MTFVFEIVSPGSDLHGEPVEIDDTDKESAWTRARRRLDDTFSLASAERRASTAIRFVAEYPSRQAYRRATEWA